MRIGEIASYQEFYRVEGFLKALQRRAVKLHKRRLTDYELSIAAATIANHYTTGYSRQGKPDPEVFEEYKDTLLRNIIGCEDLIAELKLCNSVDFESPFYDKSLDYCRRLLSIVIELERGLINSPEGDYTQGLLKDRIVKRVFPEIYDEKNRPKQETSWKFKIDELEIFARRLTDKKHCGLIELVFQKAFLDHYKECEETVTREELTELYGLKTNVTAVFEEKYLKKEVYSTEYEFLESTPLLLDLLFKQYGFTEGFKKFLESLQQEVSYEKWLKYFKHQKDFKDMPLSWWKELV